MADLTDRHGVTRAERRRQERATRKARPESDYGVMAGWCLTEDDLPEARQGLHDMLITTMGDRRVGPVQWRWWDGDKATEQLRVLRYGARGELADNYRRIGAHIREYGGFLVVAMAEGRPTRTDLS